MDNEITRRQELWAKNDLFVDGCVRADGSVSIEGQDLSVGEYEYFLTVRPENVSRLASALDVPASSDVLEKLLNRAEDLIAIGEATWLKENDIPYDFFSC